MRDQTKPQLTQFQFIFSSPIVITVSKRSSLLNHYRPAMPFGNRKFILEDLFSIVTVQKISPLWKSKI